MGSSEQFPTGKITWQRAGELFSGDKKGAAEEK